MNLINWAKQNKYQYSLPINPSSSCSRHSDKQLMRNGIFWWGFYISPQETKKRIAFCRTCKYHTYYDPISRIGLSCNELRINSLKKGASYLAAWDCPEGKFERNLLSDEELNQYLLRAYGSTTPVTITTSMQIL